MKIFKSLMVAALLLFGSISAHAQSLSVSASWPSTAINQNVDTGQYWTAPSWSSSAMATPTVGTSANTPTSTATSPSTAGIIKSMYVSLSPAVSGTTGASVTIALIDTNIWSSGTCSCSGEIFARVLSGTSSAVGFAAPAGFVLNTSHSYVILVTSDGGVEWTGSATITFQ